MRPWSNSVMTQGIRLRQRALSSTAPAMRKVTRGMKRGELFCVSAGIGTGTSPAMKACLEDISNMKKDHQS